MAGDGLAITSPEALMTYTGRALVQLASKILQEIPSALEPKLDARQLLGAISYRDVDSGERLPLGAWDLAPGSQDHSTEFDCSRAEVSDLWNEALRRKLRFFPELVDSQYWTRIAGSLTEGPSMQDTAEKGT